MYCKAELTSSASISSNKTLLELSFLDMRNLGIKSSLQTL